MVLESTIVFFGLALVFGAVGVVTSLGAGQVDTSIGDSSLACNSGQRLKSIDDKLASDDSKPLKFEDDYDSLQQVSLDPSSTSQNLSTALRLLLQALRTVPIVTYISLILSLVFLKNKKAGKIIIERPQSQAILLNSY